MSIDMQKLRQRLEELVDRMPASPPALVDDDFARHVVKNCSPFIEFTLEYTKLLTQTDTKPTVRAESLERYVEYAKLLRYTEDLFIRMYGACLEHAFNLLTSDQQMTNRQLFRMLFSLLSIMDRAPQATDEAPENFEVLVAEYRKEVEKYEQHVEGFGVEADTTADKGGSPNYSE